MCRNCENWECGECMIGEVRKKCKLNTARKRIADDQKTMGERENFFLQHCEEWEKTVRDLKQNCAPKKRPFFRFVMAGGRYTIA